MKHSDNKPRLSKTGAAQKPKAVNDTLSTNAMPDASERLVAEIAADTLKSIANLMGRIEKLEHANMILREHYLTLEQTNSQLRVRLMNLEYNAVQMLKRAEERVEQLEDIVRKTADRLGRAEGYLVEMDNRTDEIKSFLNGMCNSHD